jgi:hypothetical protein
LTWFQRIRKNSRWKRLCFCLIYKNGVRPVPEKRCAGFAAVKRKKHFSFRSRLLLSPFSAPFWFIAPLRSSELQQKFFCALLTIYKSCTPQTRVSRTPPLASGADNKGI